MSRIDRQHRERTPLNEIFEGQVNFDVFVNISHLVPPAFLVQISGRGVAIEVVACFASHLRLRHPPDLLQKGTYKTQSAFSINGESLGHFLVAKLNGECAVGRQLSILAYSRISMSRSAAANSTRTHLRSLIEHLPFPQRPRQDVVEGVAPVLDVVAAINEDVLWNT